MRCTATKHDIAHGAEMLNVGTLGVGSWANATKMVLGDSTWVHMLHERQTK